jgi:hypothetical protein
VDASEAGLARLPHSNGTSPAMTKKHFNVNQSCSSERVRKICKEKNWIESGSSFVSRRARSGVTLIERILDLRESHS